MTVRRVWIGSTGPFLYDDSVLYLDEDGVISPDNQQAIATDGQMVVQTPPTSSVHVVRKYELDNIVTTLGLGTMAFQNHNAVSISGGGMSGMSNVEAIRFDALDRAGQYQYGYVSNITAGGGVERWNIYSYGSAPSYFAGPVIFGDPAATRTNLGLGSGALITASGYAPFGAYWTSPTTLSWTDAIQFGAGGKVGLNSYGPPVNVWLRGYHTALNSLSINNGDTLARWSLDCLGEAHIQRLGVFYAPDASYHFRTGSMLVDAIVANASMYVPGTTRLAMTGIGYAPDGIHTLRVGSVQLDSCGVAGPVDSRFGLRVYNNIYCDSTPYLPTGGPWVTFSDKSLKHNITSIPHPLETMCALHGILYEWIDPKDGQQPGVHMGVLAQEVEEVLPEWVGELDGYKTTQLSRFEALTIEAIKELTARVAALEVLN